MNLSKKKTKQIKIDEVKFASRFPTNSEKLGFDSTKIQSYKQKILDLKNLWEADGFIEVYKRQVHGKRSVYPLAKKIKLST